MCYGAWHAGCYKQLEKDKFPVLGITDIDDSLMDDNRLEDEDPNRFRQARDGDHLLCEFQCDLCQFENTRGRSPDVEDSGDELALLCIRRAILDAFWSRESSTVEMNRRLGARYLEIQRKTGDRDNSRSYPPRGPFRVEDRAGMSLAITMLVRSLDKGHNANTIQYETMRKMRGHLSNFSHTCPGGTGDTFIGEELGSTTVSNSVSNSVWFRRYIRGCHRRMGDVWLPDRPVTAIEMEKSLEVLEGDWGDAVNDPGGKLQTAVTACIFSAGYFASLRGEEIGKVDLGAMRNNWSEATSYPSAPHVPLMLAGRFKREIGEKLFTQPLAPVTASGAKIQLWFERLIRCMDISGLRTGLMFRNDKGKRLSIAEMDKMVHSILVRVQKKWPSVIPQNVNVKEEYSAYRSFRRGSVAEAQNVSIPREVIEANNRWRKRSRARGSTPGMSMMERYTDAKASVPALVRFSGAL